MAQVESNTRDQAMKGNPTRCCPARRGSRPDQSPEARNAGVEVGSAGHGPALTDVIYDLISQQRNIDLDNQ